jgi:hypothetical protein
LVINDKSEFWVINVGDSSGIPAVELDITEGGLVILLFSSLENAKQYLALRNPTLINQITQLSKVSFGGHIIHSGLYKIARVALKYKNIKYFVLNHPGCVGEASYITVKELLKNLRIRKDKPKQHDNELFSFLENQK